MGVLIFIIGLIMGIMSVIYLPRLFWKLFEKTRKQYEVSLTLMYYQHPIDTTKKGEYVRTKPIVVRVLAYDEDSATSFAKEVIEDNLRIEVDTVELVKDDK